MLESLLEQIRSIQDIIDESFIPFLDCVPGTRERLNKMVGYVDALKLMADQHNLDRDACHTIANRATVIYVEQVHANYVRFPQREVVQDDGKAASPVSGRRQTHGRH